MTDFYASNTSTTGSLSLGGSVSSAVDSSGDTDWFRITLASGQVVRFDLEGTATSQGTLSDPYIHGIFDSAGTLISGTTDDDSGVGYNSLVNFSAPSSGTYYISAGGLGSSTGTYRLSATAADDYSATTSTTGTLSVGGHATGSIDSSGDVDWFRVSLTAGQAVQFDLEGSPTSQGTISDTYLRGIYDSSGTLISNTTNDDGGTGGNARVTYTAATSGTYYVAAGGYGSNTGTYRLSANGQDDYPSTVGTNGTLTVGGHTNGNIESSGDTDWFRISLSAGQVVQIDLEGHPTSQGTLSDPYLRGIYDSSGTLLSGTTDDDSGTGLNARVNFTAPSAGYYYISAGGLSSSVGTYRLSAGTTDDYAADSGTSGALTVGGHVSGNVESSGDDDWFRISLTAGQVVQFDLEGSPTSQGTLSDPYLNGIYDSSGSLLSGTSDDDSGTGYNAQVTFTAPSAGTYYVSAGGLGSSIGTYRLSANGTDDYASSTSTTGVLTVGGHVSGNIESSGDTDWFRINLFAGQLVQIDLEGSSTSQGTLGDTYLRGIYDSTGTLISGTTDDDSGTGANSLVMFTAPSTGTFYISAGAYSSGTGTYRLSAGTADDYAADSGTTGTLAVGGSITGNVESSSDNDWFRISLAAGQEVQFDLEGAPTSQGTLSDPYINGVFNAAGTLISGTSDDDSGTGYNAQVTYTAASAGTYYVSVGGLGSGTGTYRLSATDTGIEDDYAANTSTTGTLALGGSASGEIEVAGDVDWFRIHLAAGQQVQLDLEGSPTSQGTLSDTYLRGVFDSSGTYMSGTASDDNGTNLNSRVTFTATSAGDYFVAAGGYSNHVGTYHLFASGADDYAGNSGTSGVVSVGGHVSGNIESNGDTDWFRVSLAAGQQVQIDLEGASTSQGTLSDPYLRGVYDNAGALISGTSDDDSGTGYNSRVTFTATSAGNYYISAGGLGSSTGTYRLSASNVDDYTANTSTSGRLSLWGSSTGAINSANDVDWFRITLAAGQQVQFDLEGEASSQGTLSDPFLRGVYDSAGTLISNTSNDDISDSNANARVTFTATSAGNYFVAAGAYSTGTGTYRISASGADDYADDTGTSGLLAVGGSVTGTVNANGDRDWFRVSLSAGQQVQFDLEGTATTQGTLSDPYIYGIHDSSGALLPGTTDDDSGTGYNSRLTFTATTAGNYYISAGGLGSGTGTYRLSAATSDDYTAATSTTGSVFVGGHASGGINSAGDVDWFRVSLAAGQQVQIDLEGAPTQQGTLADPYLRGVYNASGVLISGTSNDDNGSNLNARVSFTATTAGNYYIAAGAAGNGTGTYRLSVGGLDDYSADTSTTGVVTVGGAASAGRIETAGDRDWFSVSLTEGTAYEFQLNSAASNGLPDTYLYLYDSTGTQLAYDDDSGPGLNSLLHYTPTSSGTFYLGAREFGSGAGNYLISAATRDDYAATTSTTGRVSADGRASGGNIESSGDQDWFAVTLSAGVAYDLRAAGAGSDSLDDPFLSLYNAQGTLINSDDDSGGGGAALLHYTPSANGTFYLGVRDFGANTGTYEVSATPQVSDDYAGDDSTSGVVTPNATNANSGRIEVSGDLDWFRVNLVGGVTYRFALNKTATGGLSDPFLTLYDSEGDAVGANDDSGGNLNSLLTYTPDSSGVYYLEASDYGNGIGNYTLRASVMDDYTATAATTGMVLVNGDAATGNIEIASDVDWFRVNLSAGVAYSIRVNAAASGGLSDPFASLLNASGTVLASNDDGGGGVNALINYTPTAAGTYYIAARDFGTGTGEYSVSVATTDDYSADVDTTGVANLAGAVTGNVNYAGDTDWFSANLTAGDTYTIRLLGAPGGNGATLADPYFRGIYDTDGELVEGTSNDDYGGSVQSQVVFIPETSGEYFLAAGAYGSYTGTYRLEVTRTAGSDIANTTATTATIAAGGRQTSVIGEAGDQDWFRASLTAGRTYVIELIADSASATPLGDPYFRGVYNSAGTLIPDTSNDDYGPSLNSRVQYTPTATDTYYLSAGGYGSATGGYTLALSQLNAITDTVGHTTATAGTVALGAAGVNGSIDFSRDVDWYRVSLSGGQNYAINARGADSNQGTLRDPSIVGVYNASGALISGTGSDDSPGSPDAQTSFRPSAAGNYYVAVTGQGEEIGTYRLSVEAQASSDIPHDTTTTSVIQVGANFNSQIDAAGDIDWIRVSLVAGEAYQVDLRGASGGHGTLSDPLIAGIYNAAGQSVPDTYNDDANNSLNSQVNFIAPAGGNYYIAAAAFGSYTGTYQLSVAPAGAGDTTAPTLQYVSPADETTGVSLTSNLSFGFDEAVRAGTGNIILSGGGQTVSIPVTSNQVTFSGETMTVNPSANLVANASYTVTMDSGVVRDIAGNNFAGITDSTQFNFTTNDGSTQGSEAWTVMVYIAADNNLERFAISDLNEMEMVNLPENVNVVTLVDRAQGYDTSNGNWTDTRQGLIVRDSNTSTVSSFANFTSLGEQNTGNGATLTNFIDWAATNFPAANYALVIWDHGGGLSGAAWDDASNNDHLSPNEVRAAIANSSVDQFGVIGYDACLMGMVEEFWNLAEYSDVLVASQELIPGDGWAYDRWLTQLASNPGLTSTDLGRAIVTTYGQEYAGQSGITLSAVQSSALAALNTSLDQFVAAASSASSTDLDALRTAASRSVFFPGDDPDYDYRDLGQFMEEAANRVSDASLRLAANSVATALDNAVFARSGTVAGATGMSIYMPYGSSQVSSSYTASEHVFLGSSNWENFLAVL